MVEMEHTVLLFDYYQGEIPTVSKEKDFFVFASHGHEDHYVKKIWELQQEYPKISYILSDDIQTKEEAFFMGPNEAADIKGIHIETLKSNDLGLHFL
jgi:hypothetical protein